MPLHETHNSKLQIVIDPAVHRNKPPTWQETKELAIYLNCAAQKIRDMARKGCPHVRLGTRFRWNTAAVDAWLTKQHSV